MAKADLDELMPQLEPMEEEIKQLLVPKDPEDEKSAILEIRAGTGGDEASIFLWCIEI
jgi:peptide chain release factor 1